MLNSEKLLNIAEQLLDKSRYDSSSIDRLKDSAEKIEESWSGSWLGYQSCVYYKNFIKPPRGARFSLEWGFMNITFNKQTIGDWVEYHFDDVIDQIYKQAGDQDISEVEKLSKETADIFDGLKSETLSLLSLYIANKDDHFIKEIIDDIKVMRNLSPTDFINALKPSGKFISRDMSALEKGLQPPPHIAVLAKIFSILSPFENCKELAKKVKQLVNHLSNISARPVCDNRIGKNIFIGHGKSVAWIELKDFISNRLSLPWDEFNRIPPAGFTIQERLSQMLDDSAIAFLIMTAEDEDKDGKLRARMNVIHEVGLFQGRLGFRRAIVLLEEGCEEFSNIHGLIEIRFPKGNISAVFEKIREILEREAILREET